VRVLLDTNVVLDLLLERQPFADAAAELASRIERGEIEGCLGAGTITTTQYLARPPVLRRLDAGDGGVGASRRQFASRRQPDVESDL
jgi:predicted nucleic acid-binding protein